MKLKRFNLSGHYHTSDKNYQEEQIPGVPTSDTKRRVELTKAGNQLTDYIALVKSANYDVSDETVLKLAVEMYTAERIAKTFEERLSGIEKSIDYLCRTVADINNY